MSRLADAMSAIARYEVARTTFCELAVVTSVFDAADGDDAQTVSIRLKDSGVVLNRVPMAVQTAGLAMLPHVDDVVVVVFPAGEPSSAIVIAQVYSDQRRPPDFTKDELVLQWPGTETEPEKAAVIRVFNDGSEREVVIDLAETDTRLRIVDGTVALVSGGVDLTLSHSSSSDGLATLKAGGATIEVAQDGDVTIESPKRIAMKASEIELQADVSFSIGGQIVEIN